MLSLLKRARPHANIALRLQAVKNVERGQWKGLRYLHEAGNTQPFDVLHARGKIQKTSRYWVQRAHRNGGHGASIRTRYTTARSAPVTSALMSRLIVAAIVWSWISIRNIVQRRGCFAARKASRWVGLVSGNDLDVPLRRPLGRIGDAHIPLPQVEKPPHLLVGQ
jgi:hypothetical protein